MRERLGEFAQSLHPDKTRLLGDTALVDGENFDLVVARQDNLTRGSADQSMRDGSNVRY
jgi:hypothetical protein